MLPPLNALRAFEVAARNGSFTAAGRELGVSSAAVSQQVRSLEEHLGKQLFARRGNRLTLTDAGVSLYPRLGEAFAALTELAASVQLGPARRGLVVSVAPSLMGWVLPRLATFRAAHEGRVELRAEDDPVTFGREGVDLRLAYGSAHYGDYRSEELFRDEAVPVVSPSLWAPGRDAEPLSSLTDRQFIHTDWGRDYASHPTWPNWFARAGLARQVDPGLGLQVSWSAHAADAAIAGIGVALVPRRVVARALDEGRLVIPSDVGLVLERPHVAVYPNAISRRADLAAFLKILKSD